MQRRIMGIETEFGVTCTFHGHRRLSPDEVARYLFRRVVSWGRSSNVFLRNGARLYLDVGSHPEYATAECDSDKVPNGDDFWSGQWELVYVSGPKPARHFKNHEIAVVSPAYCADVQGDVKVDFIAPGFTKATAKCWKQGDGMGTDSTVAEVALNDEGEGNFVGPSTPNYKGLGYECSAQQSAALLPVGNDGPPYCRTVYYLDTATGVLGGLSTTSTRYATNHGTRVGTTEQSAASREHRPAIAGCQSGISELTRNTYLYISIRGGKIRKPSGSNQPLRIVGGRVDNIAVESRHDPVGVLFC